MEEPKGFYEHFKASKNTYFVLGCGFNERDSFREVYYMALYGDQTIYSRPVEEFSEIFIQGDQRVPRFKPITPTPEQRLIAATKLQKMFLVALNS